jgi:uncharacterized protein with HEPN domain
MSDATPRVDEYLEHIQDAIGKIERYTAGMDESAFLADELVQDGVIRNLEIIGEASRNILRRHPDAAIDAIRPTLTAAYGMRNVLAHGYTEVDLHVVWVAIERDLPALRQRIDEYQS